MVASTVVAAVILRSRRRSLAASRSDPGLLLRCGLERRVVHRMVPAREARSETSGRVAGATLRIRRGGADGAASTDDVAAAGTTTSSRPPDGVCALAQCRLVRAAAAAACGNRRGGSSRREPLSADELAAANSRADCIIYRVRERDHIHICEEGSKFILRRYAPVERAPIGLCVRRVMTGPCPRLVEQCGRRSADVSTVHG